MILSLAITFAVMATGQNAKPIVCPMTAEAVGTPFASIDFAGTRYEMCCGCCPDGFKKDPAAALKSDKLKGLTVGTFLFDPISNKRIEQKDAKCGSSDFKGTRYLFASADEKAKFDANPKSFVKSPTQEVLYCAVAGHAINNYSVAGGFLDIGNTRYYTCCANCLAKLKADPSAYTSKATDQVKTPVAVDAPKPDAK